MPKAKVSFIVPVYNVEEYVAKCVDSILAQQGVAYEIILVDDGATDGSGAICDSYAQNHSCVQVIHQKNAGLSQARISGMAVAQGDYVFFVDSDDWIDPDALIRLAPYMEQNWECIMHGYREVFPTGPVEYSFTHKPLEIARPDQYQELELQLLNRHAKTSLLQEANPISAVIKLCKREFLLQHGVTFTDGFFEDILYSLKLFRARPKMVIVPVVCYNYLIRGNSISRGYKKADSGLETQLYETVEFLREDAAEKEPYRTALHARAVTNFLYLVVLDYCNPNNTLGYSQRRREFLQKRDGQIYNEALQDTRAYSDFPRERRILAWLARRRLFLAMELLNRARMVLKRKRQ